VLSDDDRELFAGFSDHSTGSPEGESYEKEIEKGKNARISENFNANSRNFTVNQIAILL
jgi:hypothetical protein